jgi:hypothetical protein
MLRQRASEYVRRTLVSRIVSKLPAHIGLQSTNHATVDSIIRRALNESVLEIDHEFLVERNAWLRNRYGESFDESDFGNAERLAQLQLAAASQAAKRLPAVPGIDDSDGGTTMQRMTLLEQVIAEGNAPEQQQIDYAKNIGVLDPNFAVHDEFIDQMTDGTTAVVACLTESNLLVVSNTGDSRAVLIKHTPLGARSLQTVALTVDHKPMDASEKYVGSRQVTSIDACMHGLIGAAWWHSARITALGGFISFSGVWRVMGGTVSVLMLRCHDCIVFMLVVVVVDSGCCTRFGNDACHR